MKIVITGFMGSGKTSVARQLARRLNVPMVDLDERIMEKEGRSPAQLIVEEGEEAFRVIESEKLRELLETDTARVIALGGGAWIEDRNRALVEQYNFISVWLDVPFDVCWSRIESSGENRPLAKSRSQALTLYESRRPFYQLADIHIDVLDRENLEGLISHIKDEFDRR